MAATANEVRRILTDMLGPLGPHVGANGALDPGQDPNPNPDTPVLMDRLTNLRQRGDLNKPPGPETFRGTQEENARLWKTKMVDYLAHGGYPNDEVKLRIIKMFLADCALVWYLSLPAAQVDTVEHFWTAFTAQYLGPGTQYAVEQALMARKQEPTEDANTYMAEVITKANRLGWDQNRTMQHLISGLNNQLKPLVMMKTPQDLQETCRAIGTAKEAAKSQSIGLESVQSAIKDLVTQLKTDKEDRKVTTLHQQTAIQPVQQPIETQPRFNRSPRFNNYRGRFQNTRTQPIIHIHTPGPNNTPSGQPMRPRPFTPSSRNIGQCWQCGLTGHYQSNCPRQRTKITCTTCLKTGHYSSECFSRRNNTNFQRRNTPQGNRGQFSLTKGRFNNFRGRQGN